MNQGTDPRQPDPAGQRRRVMRRAARMYTPTRMWDYLFLHGLALQAARRALREDDRLFVPLEWQDADDSGDASEEDAGA